MAYGSEVDKEENNNTSNLIQQMIQCFSEVHSELLQKQKFHMLLHLQDDMLNYRPRVGFNTERLDCMVVISLLVLYYKKAEKVKGKPVKRTC